MAAKHVVTVFGAYGHTGRFVVSELCDRGWEPILSGRDVDKLRALGAAHPGLRTRPASVDDAASLDAALVGAEAVINCAGPFAETSAPVIEAAVRAKVPYLDVAAEIEAVADTFERYAGRARDAGVAIVPSVAFFGGLGALLAGAAAGDWRAVDEICIAYALDSWKPTAGTRATTHVSKRRREGRRIVFANGQLEHRTTAAPRADWVFPQPIGARAVVAEFTTADSVTVARHLQTPDVHTFMTVGAVEDLLSPSSPPPAAADEKGRSAQTFLVEVVVRSGGRERRAVASGRDIYAVSAPLVVEAAGRLLDGASGAAGVFAAGELFDARDFLNSLCPTHLSLTFS